MAARASEVPAIPIAERVNASARVAFAVIAGMSTAPSCGSETDTTGPIPVGALSGELAKAFCQRVYTCCDATERMAESVWGPDYTACVTTLAAQLVPGVTDLQADISAGRIVYHADIARRCVDKLASLPCAEWGVDFSPTAIDDCKQFTAGTAPPGAACGLGTVGLFCTTGACGANADQTALVCVEVPANVGEPCQYDVGCGVGLFCSIDGSGSPSTCQVRQPIGATCNQNDGCQNHNCPAATGTEPRVCALVTVCDGT